MYQLTLWMKHLCMKIRFHTLISQGCKGSRSTVEGADVIISNAHTQYACIL